MAYRKPIKKSASKKLFKNTATRTKAINLNSFNVPRGGYRL